MPTPEDFTKLTVPQLKSLCKDKGISGYSKLNKVALIQKLNSVALSDRTKLLQQEPSPQVSNRDRPLTEVLPSYSSQEPSPELRQAICLVPIQANVTQHSLRPGMPSALVTQPAPVLTARSRGSREKRPATIPTENATKRQRRLDLAGVSVLAEGASESEEDIARIHPTSGLDDVNKQTNLFPALASAVMNPRPSFQIASTGQPSRSLVAVQDSLLNASQNLFKIPDLPQKAFAPETTTPATAHMRQTSVKRFRPLMMTARPANSSELVPLHTTSVTNDKSRSQVPLRYLEFHPSPQVSLTTIKYPPSISQRKHVQRWAVVLIGLSNAERRQCVLVSRMFRYAVYLSSVTKLSNDFNGKRLDQVARMHSQIMTDMWPYLRIRQDEIAQQRASYLNSFIADYYKDFEPISRRLWTSPDHAKQYEVAIRFVMTKLWFALSIGSGGDDSAWLYCVVVDAQEIVKEEVWSITVSHPGANNDMLAEVFYVLEPTCEVVGYSPASPCKVPLRADWSTYIEQRASSCSKGLAVQPLLSLIKWANYEEYDRGVSRLWLKQISQSEIGIDKQQVAFRYILACVVGNSVSGSWMSVNEMAQQDSSGGSMSIGRKSRNMQVNMFLSAHHHVESLHFMRQDGKPLHPALAVVQTIGREYYILKDNGMQVGCEEEGVAPVWMELLKCDYRGCPVVL